MLHNARHVILSFSQNVINTCVALRRDLSHAAKCSHCQLNCLVPASSTTLHGIARGLTEIRVSGILGKILPIDVAFQKTRSILDEWLRAHGSSRRCIHWGNHCPSCISKYACYLQYMPFPFPPQTVCHMFPERRSASTRYTSGEADCSRYYT